MPSSSPVTARLTPADGKRRMRSASIEMDDIHREVEQIPGIKSIEVSRIGFISASGFKQKEDGFL